MIALVALGAFWILVRLGFVFPNSHAFEVAADRAMKYVEPLPPSLRVVERWENCGHGGDPLCDSITMLIDDRTTTSVPISKLVEHLEKSGWAFELDEPASVIKGKRERDWVEVTSVGQALVVSETVELDRFVDENRYEELAHLEVIVWVD